MELHHQTQPEDILKPKMLSGPAGLSPAITVSPPVLSQLSGGLLDALLIS